MKTFCLSNGITKIVKVYVTRDKGLIFRKNEELEQINKKRSLNRKMVKGLQWHFRKEDIYIANKYRNNCLLIIREIKI